MKRGSLVLCVPLIALGCNDAWQPNDPNVENQPVGSAARTPVYGATTTATPPPPISGGTLRILADGDTAIASDPDRDTVWVVDLPSRSVRGAVTLQPGDEPGRVVEGSPGFVHVVLRRGGSIATIDTHGAGSLVRRTPVCTTPRGIDYDGASGALWVACTDGELLTLDEATGAQRANQQIETDLRDVVVHGGTVYVSQFRSARVFAVTSNAQRREITPASMQIDNTVAEVVWRIVGNPHGSGVVMVHQLAESGQVSVNDVHGGGGGDFGTTTTESSGGAYGGGSSCTPAIVEGAVSIVDDTSVHPLLQPQPLPTAVLPVDIAVTPTRTVVIAAGNASIRGMPQVIDVNTSLNSGCFGGEPPTSMTQTQPDQPNAQAVAAAFDRQEHLVVQTREPPAIYLMDEHAVIPLPGASRADTGHEIFYSNTGANIACASCHAEGADDGHVWNFSDVGLRRTQNLAGTAIGDGPFHWGGELPHFGDVVSQIFQARMGGPLLSGSQSDALHRYVHAIPRPMAPTMDASAVERGRTLFENPIVGCATCHNGARFTNDAIVNVGTGGMFKVPSLIGIASHPPYFHTGCALTLTARFDTGNVSCNGGDQHGHTSQLTSPQIADLVAYLETL